MGMYGVWSNVLGQTVLKSRLSLFFTLARLLKFFVPRSPPLQNRDN